MRLGRSGFNATQVVRFHQLSAVSPETLVFLGQFHVVFTIMMWPSCQTSAMPAWARKMIAMKRHTRSMRASSLKGGIWFPINGDRLKMGLYVALITLQIEAFARTPVVRKIDFRQQAGSGL
jgi:hypothetical protein